MSASRYDLDQAIQIAREAMRRGDAITWSTLQLARTMADHFARTFDADDLEPIARGLIYGAAVLGGQLEGRPAVAAQSFLATVSINTQTMAAVLILDQLEIDQLEAALKVQP